MKTIVVIGTSHSTKTYSPSYIKALETVGTVKNLAAHGHGIDTYFPRVRSQLAVPDKNSVTNAIFIIEAPHHTRYTEFMNEKGYTPFSYAKEEFWTENEYMRYLAFYSKTVLLAENEYWPEIRSSRNDLKALQRINVLANEKLELEDNIIKCAALDGWIKNNGHEVYWWTANNKLLHSYSYPFDLILNKPLFEYFPDRKLYSDGYHLDDKYFGPFVEEFFLQKLKINK